MRLLRLFTVLILLIALVAEAGADTRFLRASGRRIVNGNGDPVQLRGCNIGCWLLIEPWMIGAEHCPGVKSEKALWDLLKKRFGEATTLDLIKTYRDTFFTERDVDRLAATGINCIRVPIWWRAIDDPAYGGDIDYLDRCIEWCSKRGIYVILDLHGAPGTQSTQSVIVGEPADAGLWKSDEFKRQTIEWWTRIAERYKDEPAVAGYDVLNEAFSAPFDDLLSFYDDVYRAVRAVDPKHILIFEDGLQGFHRLPVPAERGWENVVYSFHYYPHSREEAMNAPGITFPGFNRACIYFGVPVLIGEFNTIFTERGGADMFLRYCNVFDYYDWAWTFWSFKKLEENHDTLWGLYGYCSVLPTRDFHNETAAGISAAFESMNTDRLGRQPLLEEALRAFPRWTAEGVPPEGAALLSLREVYLVRAEEGAIRIEWRWTPPNIGYWAKGDYVAWGIDIAEDGVYEFGLNLASEAEHNRIKLFIDGVGAVPVPVRGTDGWTTYKDRGVGRYDLAAGHHMIFVTQSDSVNGFINVRHAWTRPVDGVGDALAEDVIVLNPMSRPKMPTGSRMRVEWMNHPPDFGFWTPGESVSWSVDLQDGGTYAAEITYVTPVVGTKAEILADGVRVTGADLEATGDWQEYLSASLGSVVLRRGHHEVAVVWSGENTTDVGNLRGITLIRKSVKTL